MNKETQGDEYFTHGCNAYDEGNMLEAFRKFAKGAILGDPCCQTWLEDLYDSGFSVKTNLAKSILWYKKAIKGKEVEVAPWNLMLVYRDMGNKEMECLYLKMAADFGHEDAKKKINHPAQEQRRKKRQKKIRLMERAVNSLKAFNRKKLPSYYKTIRRKYKKLIRKHSSKNTLIETPWLFFLKP